MNAKNQAITEDLLSFINHSPTAFHAVGQISGILESYGFQKLEEADDWNLQSGGKYYITRNQSSVIAFQLPSERPTETLICASHTDSPMFKLKQNAESCAFGTYVRLNTEVYGGTILPSWLDRPLSLAGRVILKQNGVIRSVLVCFDRDLLVIPNVAIHMNRNINSGYAYNPAVDMMPLFSMTDSHVSLNDLISKELDCKPEEIAGSDLFVFNRMQGTVWGADHEFFSAPRIDNLMCAYGTLQGFCRSAESDSSLKIYYSADNEETGSATKQGAGSVFLSDVLDRICRSYQIDKRRLLASSFMVSADNGHAKHPNHPELSDAENAPRMNGGVVIKCNAAQKYTTDGISAAIFTEICNHAGVPVQTFANRSDQRGGSTLGSISNTLVPLATVDIGMAQLAMHSCFETAGCSDTAYLIRAMEEFYQTKVRSDQDGIFRLNFHMGKGN